MKITGVTVFSAASTAGVERAHWAVEIGTDEGLTGFAIAPSDLGADVTAVAEAALIGEDPRGVTGLWQRMCDRAGADRTSRRFNEILSALDVALWDLKAKANGEPLWKTLGGARPRVNVHLSEPTAPLNDAQLDQWMATAAASSGFRGVRLTASGDAATDARRLGIARAVLARQTEEPVLMLDADESWSEKEAVSRILALEERFDLTWIEAPVASTNAAALRRVSRSVSAAVCAGRKLGGPAEFLPHFRERSLDVVQLGAGNGGLTGVLQLADSAFGFELPVALAASPGHFLAHVGAVLPSVMSLEVIEPATTSAAFTSDVRIEDGWAIAGDAPGHGLTLARRPA